MPVTAPFVEQLLTNMAAAAQDRVAIILKFMRYEVWEPYTWQLLRQNLQAMCGSRETGNGGSWVRNNFCLGNPFFYSASSKRGNPIHTNH